MEERSITQSILDAYYEKFRFCITGDLIIAGAGPAGLTAGLYAAKGGMKVTLIEQSLATGGGIWGGGMAMNAVTVEEDALPLLEDIRVRYRRSASGLFILDACELAAALSCSAIQAGVQILNLMTVEDVCVKSGRVTGVVANRTKISNVLPVDPVVFEAKTTVDATGHEAVLAGCLSKRGLADPAGPGHRAQEGPMDAEAGEKFVVDTTKEIYPGLWVAGMSVASFFGGPRMGPVFGGMLRSGKRVADELLSRSAAVR